MILEHCDCPTCYAHNLSVIEAEMGEIRDFYKREMDLELEPLQRSIAELQSGDRLYWTTFAEEYGIAEPGEVYGVSPSQQVLPDLQALNAWVAEYIRNPVPRKPPSFWDYVGRVILGVFGVR